MFGNMRWTWKVIQLWWITYWLWSRTEAKNTSCRKMLSELSLVLFVMWKRCNVSAVAFPAGVSPSPSGAPEGSMPIPASAILETELCDWSQVLFVIGWQYGWAVSPNCDRSGCSGSLRVAFKAIDNSIVWLHCGTEGAGDGNVFGCKSYCCITCSDVHTCCQSACRWVRNPGLECSLFQMYKNIPMKDRTLMLCMFCVFATCRTACDTKHKSGLLLLVMSQRGICISLPDQWRTPSLIIHKMYEI